MFYKFFQQPLLTVLRDGGIRVVTSEGKDILLEPLPPGTPDEVVVAEAEKVLYALVLRGIFNPIPVMRQWKEDLPYIQLTKEGTHRIRHAAVLRKFIPYILIKTVKSIVPTSYHIIKKAFDSQATETFIKTGEKRSISCDAVCSFVDQTFHQRIYESGQVAGTGWVYDDLYLFADEAGVVLSSQVDYHPLEDKSNYAKEWTPPQPKIDVAVAADIPPAGDAQAAYPVDINSIPGRFGRIIQRVKNSASEEVYAIGGVPVNRYQYMKYICIKMTEGDKLRDICNGVSGAPSLFEIHKWQKYHPDFARDLMAAEQVQAYVFADKALDVAEGVTDKDDVAAARLLYKAYMDRAALQSEKFRPKQVVQTENLDNKNVSELKAQLRMLLENAGDLIAGEVVPVSEPSRVVKDVTPVASEEEFYEEDEEGPPDE